MLTIDDRENVKVKNKVLMMMGDHQIDPKGQAQVDRLPVGDYIIPEVGWGVEAKEINDLYQSITGQGRSRTVNAQLVDLADHFDIPFLVVYGTQLKPFVRGKPNRRDLAIQMERMKRTIKAFKETLHVRHPKIRFMQLETMDDFVSWLAQNHAQMMMAAKKPQERQKLMAEHMKLMQGGMSMMKQMSGQSMNANMADRQQMMEKRMDMMQSMMQMMMDCMPPSTTK